MNKENILKKMEEEEKKELLNAPLNEGVLNTNCGIPIVFVINKSDVVNQSSEKNIRKKFRIYFKSCTFYCFGIWGNNCIYLW